MLFAGIFFYMSGYDSCVSVCFNCYPFEFYIVWIFKKFVFFFYVLRMKNLTYFAIFNNIDMMDIPFIVSRNFL